MADLSRPVSYRGQALNTAAVANDIIIGCLVDMLDYSEVEVRQFTEPFALKDGIDVGGVWLGARLVRMQGTVYDATRALCAARIDALDAAFSPVAEFRANPSSFGFAPLVFYALSGSQKTLWVRPNGLRVAYNRDSSGGGANDPLAIPWSVTFVAREPNIS